jgi:hypothetical protein
MIRICNVGYSIFFSSQQARLLSRYVGYIYIYIWKNFTITLYLLSLLQLSTQTLKSINLGYPSFNLFQSQSSIKIFR